MNKAIVGITGYHVSGEEGFGGKMRGFAGQGFSVVGHDYINAVQKVGGVPLGLPVCQPEDCADLVASVDALVITGGEDVNPRLYGAHPDLRCSALSPERDTFELALIQAALAQNKPILCICRGLQILNVYFGGTLYRDISDHAASVLAHQFDKVPRWYAAHAVDLKAPLLRKLYGKDEVEVNSYHHQAVESVGQGLQVAAVAKDGIVEALVHSDFPDLLAVQWHPEMTAVKLEEGLIPFRWLLGRISK
jgi:putative glutamine amidotransferase